MNVNHRESITYQANLILYNSVPGHFSGSGPALAKICIYDNTRTVITSTFTRVNMKISMTIL